MKSQTQPLIITMQVTEVEAYFTIFTVQLCKTLLLQITMLLMDLTLLAIPQKSS